jgi:isoamylase
MNDEAWSAGFVRCLGVRLAGDLIGELNERGERVLGDTLLILLNGHHESIPFTLPVPREGQRWERVLDTAGPEGDGAAPVQDDRPYRLEGRSLAVLKISSPPQPSPAAGSEGQSATIEVATASSGVVTIAASPTK